MKIQKITEDSIIFDNGNRIDYHSDSEYSNNYAAFTEIDDIAKDFEFEEDLVFEEIPDCGFRFGNMPNKMVFIPCYSEQNGYYSDEVDIYYKNELVLSSVECEVHNGY